MMMVAAHNTGVAIPITRGSFPEPAHRIALDCYLHDWKVNQKRGGGTLESPA